MTIAPQLSSVSTALTELTTRVAGLAESLSGSQRDDVAAALFEVERSLKTAGRRLDKVVSDLR
jgi:DNA/RNA-binding domain of Phe-tRNA-synthetase-like protein